MARLLEQEGLRVIVNRSATADIGSSIACAVAACRDAQGWVIAANSDRLDLIETAEQGVIVDIDCIDDLQAKVSQTRSQ